MKQYRYIVTWEDERKGTSWQEAMTFYARDVHAGYRKALNYAIKTRLKTWTMISLANEIERERQSNDAED